MTAPISIVERLPDAKCQQSALEHLEAALRRVKDGTTVTIGIVEVCSDGATMTHHSHSENINLLLGGISRLAHRLNAYLDEATR